MKSTLLPLFTVTSLISQHRCDYVGHSVSGEVGHDNFTYFTLRQTGHVTMVLTSHTGDADLYISDGEQERPTYLYEEHMLSSTTCGVDTVDIPASFSRPVHIGVYGHPNYPHSTFTLEGVIVEEEEYDPFSQASYDEDYPEDDDNSNKPSDKKKRHTDHDDGYSEYLREGSPLRIILTVLGSILEILLEILI